MKRYLIVLMFLFVCLAVQAQNTGNANINIETRDAFYPGGQEAFDAYVFKHLTYSAEAKAAKVSGEIMTSFFVEKDSSVNEIKVLSDTGYEVGERLKEVLKKMKFAPALANGTPIRSKVIMYVPVRAH
jgi:hypothetical protein